MRDISSVKTHRLATACHYYIIVLKNGANTMLQLQEFPAFAVSLAAKLNFMWQAKLPDRRNYIW